MRCIWALVVTPFSNVERYIYIGQWEDADDSTCSSSNGEVVIEDEEMVVSSEGTLAEKVHLGTCAANSACRRLHQLISDEGLERICPPLDGTAFYPKICHMNVRNE